MAESENPQQQQLKQKPQWHSCKNIEIKHELILYAELAAAAAFIVGLYVLCLLPFEYIHRAQMLSSRLHPSEVLIEHAKNLRDSCNINDSISFTIDYKLTKRPCETVPMPERSIQMGVVSFFHFFYKFNNYNYLF
uniref:Uncharacterized protein n=1 Tax=Panagrolaimus davidi TaxID=227884 RepID=A0A914PVH9_9BILA